MHFPFKRTQRARLSVEATSGGVLAILSDCGLLDEDSTPAVEEQLFRLAEQLGPAELRLNLGEVRFLSSTAMGMFVNLHKTLRGQGGSLTLCDVNEDVLELFEVTRLNRLLDIRRAASSDMAE